MLTLGYSALTGADAALVGPLFTASGSGISVDLDRTFLLMMVLLFALSVMLKPILFDPVLAIFAEREKRTDGAKADAREMQEKAGELLRKYERELEEVNRVAGEEREKVRAETARLEAEILEEARQSVGRIVDDGRARVQEEVQSIRFDLGRKSADIAKQAAATVLGREMR